MSFSFSLSVCMPNYLCLFVCLYYKLLYILSVCLLDCLFVSLSLIFQSFSVCLSLRSVCVYIFDYISLFIPLPFWPDLITYLFICQTKVKVLLSEDVDDNKTANVSTASNTSTSRSTVPTRNDVIQATVQELARLKGSGGNDTSSKMYV